MVIQGGGDSTVFQACCNRYHTNTPTPHTNEESAQPGELCSSLQLNLSARPSEVAAPDILVENTATPGREGNGGASYQEY